MRRIVIKPYGNLGNQMFQYLFAMAFASRTGAEIRGYRMPDWDLVDTEPPARPNRLWIGVRRHKLPFDLLVELFRAEKRIDLLVEGVACRMEYWEDQLAAARRVFRADPAAVGGGPHELVINVRAAEILQRAHGNYMPLPLSLYDELLAATGLEPVFVGQLASNRYTDTIRERFPGARMLSHGTPLGDFAFLRASVNVVPSISTYSWLATWLSETVCRIYHPVAGLFNPAVRADVDLLPVGDPRYRPVRMNLEAWDASEAELERLIDGTPADFDLAF